MMGLQVSVLLHILPMAQKRQFGQRGWSRRARLLRSQIVEQRQNFAEVNFPRNLRLQIRNSLIST